MGGFRETVGIHPEEQPPVDPVGFPVVADSRTDRHYMGFVEAAVAGSSAVSRSAESNALGGIFGVGYYMVEVGQEAGSVYQQFGRNWPTGECVSAHDGFVGAIM